MYLQKCLIKNFRCFDEIGIEFSFQPGINIIIGENNSGKSTLIDGLRIALSWGMGKREVYVSPRDFHINDEGDCAEEIGLDLTFAGLSEEEQAGFYELLVVEGNKFLAQLHIRFRKNEVQGVERVKTQIWGGEKFGQPISYETFELINLCYLEPLRDAERDLRPGRGSRIGQLVRHLISGDDEKQSLINHIKIANRKILSEPKVKFAGSIINNHLFQIEGNNLKQNINLGLLPPEFNKVTDSLRALLPINGSTLKASISVDRWRQITEQNQAIEQLFNGNIRVKDGKAIISIGGISEDGREIIGEEVYSELIENSIYFDLDQNGMGYNNLIYMGTVLGDLLERKKVESSSFNALLIEEPEAHLHPQLQDLVFDFFNNVCSLRDSDASPGVVQVFITSHSPTLTSRADINSISVIYRSQHGKMNVTPLANCPLEKKHQDDLRRYLDVTKSQLFFSRGVIFVEGITEALLLPVLARRLKRRIDQNAVEIVNVSGTSFEPFARLFNSNESNQRINIRAAILTDDDRCTNSDDPHRILEDDSVEGIQEKLLNGQVSTRAQRTISFQCENLRVGIGYKTLEFELAKYATNIPVLLSALGEIRPRIAERIDRAYAEDSNLNSTAIRLWKACKECKAEFAQKLAAKLNQKDDEDNFSFGFIVPEYISNVIQYVAPMETSD